MLIVPALLILGGAYYWLTSGGSVSTDDAQVKQDIVSVSPQVTGQIGRGLVRNGAPGEARRPAVPDRPAALPRRARAGQGALANGAASDERAAGRRPREPAATSPAPQANLAIKRTRSAGSRRC